MEKRDFNFILSLIEEGDDTSAIYLLKENHPQSFELLHKEILENEDVKLSATYAEIFRNVLEKFAPYLISTYLQKEYTSLAKLFIHANAYLYNTDYLTLSKGYTEYIPSILNEIKRQQIRDLAPRQAIDRLHEIIAKRFIIDSLSDNTSNLSHTMAYQGISQYSLAIFYLIAAEETRLPIFGLPFEDKLALIYTKDHCDHNESVYEDDILYYILVGEKDIIYTPLDLELYAIMNDETLTIHQKLPKSNSQIIQKWMTYAIDQIHDIHAKNRLSIKYQQINELISQFESF